jgi:hypothetical protein
MTPDFHRCGLIDPAKPCRCEREERVIEIFGDDETDEFM